MKRSIEDVIDGSEVIVIGNGSVSTEDRDQLGHGQVVIDLVRAFGIRDLGQRLSRDLLVSSGGSVAAGVTRPAIGRLMRILWVKAGRTCRSIRAERSDPSTFFKSAGEPSRRDDALILRGRSATTTTTERLGSVPRRSLSRHWGANQHTGCRTRTMSGTCRLPPLCGLEVYVAGRSAPDCRLDGGGPIRCDGLRFSRRVVNFRDLTSHAYRAVSAQRGVRAVGTTGAAQPNAVKRLGVRLEARRMAAYERAAVGRFHHVVAVLGE